MRQMSLVEREFRTMGSVMSDASKLKEALGKKSAEVDACKRELRVTSR